MTMTPSGIEVRPHRERDYRSDFGKSTVEVECPFCKTWVRAYVWSMAGSGKRCPTCGAVHGSFGHTRAPKQNEKKKK